MIDGSRLVAALRLRCAVAHLVIAAVVRRYRWSSRWDSRWAGRLGTAAFIHLSIIPEMVQIGLEHGEVPMKQAWRRRLRALGTGD